ncbi:MAG: BtrH N-terminal domain-containing protein [Candidatus Thorarchaeota archaeon]
MKYSALLLSALIVISFIPFGGSSQVTPAMVSPTSDIQLADEGLVEGVPYVWQEINGFCGWAATSMALQAIDVDLDLYDVFAASTTGFSYAYVSFNDTILTYPGVLYTQAEPTHFLSELYGVNYTIYLSGDLPNIDVIKQAWESQGLQVGLIDDQEDAFDLLRTTIDSGYPILLSVDPVWLPAVDYDYLRNASASGGGHGIVVVGYNDTKGTVTILDPGVGSFGDLFGYPDDGRGDYVEMSITALSNAWANRFYISNVFKPLDEAPEDVSDILLPEIRDKLLGVGTTYAPSSSTAYIWSYGEKGFRDMSEDITAESLLEYFSLFDGIENERAFKSSLLLFLGLGLETSITLQYLSYRTSLGALPSLIQNTDLTTFLDAAEDALLPMENLSDNATLIHPGNISVINGLLSRTFSDISKLYNSTGNMAAALSEFSAPLTQISVNMLAVADAWLSAGNELVELYPTDLITLYGGWILLGTIAVGAFIVVTIWYIRKIPSQ